MPIVSLDSFERSDTVTGGPLSWELPAGLVLRARFDADGDLPGLLVVLGDCPSLSSSIRTPTLLVEDPTPEAPGTPSGWFVGVPGAGLPDALARVVGHTAARTGGRVVIVGCGTSGFAALELARRLPGAGAVVWHAATNLLALAREPATSLLTTLVGGTWTGDDWRERAASTLTEAGICHDLSVGGLPRDLFWLQDATPARLRAQVAAFLDAHGFADQGAGLHLAGATRGVLLGRFGTDPVPALLDRAVAAHLAGAPDARALAAALDAAGARDDTELTALPGDLRARADAEAAFTLSAHSALDRCHGRVGGTGITWPGVDYVWVAMGDAGVLARDTTRGPAWMHIPAAPVRRILCTVRDGFGHPLAQLSVVPDRSAARRNANHVFILGSCVSRDAFALDGMPKLGHYTARTSLASSFDSRPTGLEDADLSANPSPFQRRMVAADLRRELRDELATPRYGWLLVDMIDERFDLVRGPGGGLFTLSLEARDCGLADEDAPVYPAGSSTHLAGFTRGWRELCHLVPPERIIVNEAYWALEDTDGVPLPDQEAIIAGNALMDRLYEIVRHVSPGVHWLRYPREVFVADPGHRWGQAAFHYAPAFYEATREQLAALVRTGRRRRQKQAYLERRERIVATLQARRAERLARRAERQADLTRRSGGPAAPA